MTQDLRREDEVTYSHKNTNSKQQSKDRITYGVNLNFATLMSPQLLILIAVRLSK